MQRHRHTCRLSQRELVDLEFLEQRNRVLELAAFLDRLERAAERDGADDFRLAALRRALGVLGEHGDGPRVERIQMVFSDPRTDLLLELDRKAAWGAYGGQEAPTR